MVFCKGCNKEWRTPCYGINWREININSNYQTRLHGQGGICSKPWEMHMSWLKKGDNKKHQRLRKQRERKHQVTKECFGFRGLCRVQNPRRLLALPGPVVGNEAVKTRWRTAYRGLWKCWGGGLGVILNVKSLTHRISLFLLCVWADLMSIVAIHSSTHGFDEWDLFWKWSVSGKIKQVVGNGNFTLRSNWSLEIGLSYSSRVDQWSHVWPSTLFSQISRTPSFSQVHCHVAKRWHFLYFCASSDIHETTSWHIQCKQWWYMVLVESLFKRRTSILLLFLLLESTHGALAATLVQNPRRLLTLKVNPRRLRTRTSP